MMFPITRSVLNRARFGEAFMTMKVAPRVAIRSPMNLSRVILSSRRGDANKTAKIGVRFSKRSASLAVVNSRPMY